jgi:two-component system chemotaxis response regulator CheB
VSKRQIQVLIVDDSAIVRGLLARALESDSDISVSGTAMHGKAALSWLNKHPVDIIILDVEMPVMDGLETLKRIQVEFPNLPVIMASSLTYHGAETTVKALALGASGCIAKPATKSVSESIDQIVLELVPLVKALAEKKSRKLSSGHSEPIFKRSPEERRQRFVPQILVIGSSTGGPKALTSLLADLPTDLSIPILITQHMPPLFTPMLAKHLTQDTGFPCQEGADGTVLERGHVYVAPGDFHMSVTKIADRMVTQLNQDPPEHYCRPSVNFLFRSAAEWYGHSVLGVMLTGMGDDGIEGTRDIVSRQGYMIAQDEESSVVWGMPAAVVNENLADEVLPLNQIASSITRLASRSLLAHESC